MSAPVSGIKEALNAVMDGIPFLSAELALSAVFLLLIVAGLFKKLPESALLVLTLAGLALAAVLTWRQFAAVPEAPIFSGMVRITTAGLSFRLIFYLTSALFGVFVFLNSALRAHEKGVADLLAILLAITLGMDLMAMSSNLLMIFLSVELVSVGSYLLVGYTSAGKKHSEAAMKYALFGAVASAVMLYGMSLLYAITGTLNLFDPAFAAGLDRVGLLAAGVPLMLVLAGIGFKLSFVPMHIWSPDVYEGAPTPVTAFLSAGPKLAGFALLVLFLSAFPADTQLRSPLTAGLGSVAILTMIFGNFAAIWQDNMKRLLAYSSIGHTGFMLMAVVAGPEGNPALLFYGFSYTLMIFGTLLLADHFEEQTGVVTISGYKGFGKHFPLAMTAMVILLVALTGIPPTAGFFGKLLVFSAVWEHYRSSGSVTDIVLMSTGAVTTVVSLFYYFKIPLNAWLRAADYPAHAIVPAGAKVILAVALTALVILLGVFPGLVI